MKKLVLGILVGLMLAFTGVALADKFVPVGPNLILNGDFEAGATGWTAWRPANLVDIVDEGPPHNKAGICWDGYWKKELYGEALHPTFYGTGPAQSVSVVSGNLYYLEFDRKNINPSNLTGGLMLSGADIVKASPLIMGRAQNNQVYWDNPIGEWVKQTMILKATESTIGIHLYPVSGSRTAIDNVSLRNVEVVKEAGIAPGSTIGEVREGWRIDFNDETLQGGIASYWDANKKALDDSRLEVFVKNGILNLDAKFGENSDNDWAECKWAKDWGEIKYRPGYQSIYDRPGKSIGPISLSEYPVLEVRYSLSEAPLYVHVEYQLPDGTTMWRYFGIPDTGGKFGTNSIRLVDVSSFIKGSIPNKVVGVTVWTRGRKVGLIQIDWIRLRTLMPEEASQDQEWLKHLKGYNPPDFKMLHEFFPFGVYTLGSGPMHPEHRFSHMARNHFNFGGIHVDARYENVIAATRATGMKVFASVEETNYRYGANIMKEGYEAVRESFESVARFVGESPDIIGWYIADEPGISSLPGLVFVKKMIEDVDPTRPVAINFNDPGVVQMFNPYLSFISTDRYPDPFWGRTLVEVFEWCRRIAKDNNQKRHWIILQCFGSQPWDKDWQYPTVPEVRMITYAALAGGARGLMYLSYNDYWARMMVDLFGNPLGEHFAELGRLAEKIIPIGHRLLETTVDFDAQITSDNAKLLVGVLYDSKRKVRYVVVVNTDVNAPLSGTLNLPADWQSLQTRVYDLFTLKEVSPKVTKLDVASLAPGDGRIYLVGSAKDFEADRLAIETKRIEETLRVQMSDISIAKRYGGNLEEVEKLREGARTAIAAKDIPEGVKLAKDAGDSLEKIVKTLEPYVTMRSKIEEAGRLLGSIEPAMRDENKKVELEVGSLRKDVGKLSGRWGKAFGDVITGPHDGLSEEVDKVLIEAKEAVKAVKGKLKGQPQW